MPDEVTFKPKTEIAFEQVHWACEAGVPRGAVMMDAGYGASTELRSSITALGLTYVAGILSTTTVWRSGEEPLPPKRWSGRGRPTKLMRRDAEHQPRSIKELALKLPASAWRKVTWREAAAAPLSSRFARVRARVAYRDYWLSETADVSSLNIVRAVAALASDLGVAATAEGVETCEQFDLIRSGAVPRIQGFL